MGIDTEMLEQAFLRGFNEGRNVGYEEGFEEGLRINYENILRDR